MRKMRASEIFQQFQVPKQPQEDVSNHTNEDLYDIQVEEVMEEELSTSPKQQIHYYVRNEDEPNSPSNHSIMAKPTASQPISHFLRVLEIHVSISSRIRIQPLINYSDSQVLTSSEHVKKLQHISEKKANMEEEREERVAKKKESDLTKARKAREKMLAGDAKDRRAIEKEAQKLAKQNWT